MIGWKMGCKFFHDWGPWRNERIEQEVYVGEIGYVGVNYLTRHHKCALCGKTKTQRKIIGERERLVLEGELPILSRTERRLAAGGILVREHAQ